MIHKGEREPSFLHKRLMVVKGYERRKENRRETVITKEEQSETNINYEIRPEILIGWPDGTKHHNGGKI